MKKKRVLNLTLAALLLSLFFTARAEILYPVEAIGISLNGVLNLNSGTMRSPQEFTQPVKMGEAVQAPFNINMDTIKTAAQEHGVWSSTSLFQGYHHQFVFYPDNLRPLDLVQNEPEGRSSLFQINNHPEIGLTFAIKDNNFAAVPIVSSSATGYFCFFGEDSSAPVAQCGYREGITTANLFFTSRLYLLPPAVARNIDENAYNTADPIVINETVQLGRVAIRQKRCDAFSCTYEPDNFYFNLALNISAIIEPGSCGLVGDALDRTIDLGEISQQEMNQATAPLYRNKTINLQFKCPSYANVKVSMYIEDLISPSNNSHVLSTTTGEGYAGGVGIALQGKGPYDASPVDLNMMKYNMRTVIDTNNATGFNYVITPYLGKMGPITSGIIEAKAKVVFQYD